MPASERMDPVDITWLRMDRPTNLMVIVGVLMLSFDHESSRLHRAGPMIYRHLTAAVELE